MDQGNEVNINLEKVVHDITAARKKEHARVMEDTAVERGWWPPETRFLRREQAEQSGVLMEVPHEADHYQLIWKLRKPIEENGEPDTLRPEAYKALTTIANEWAEKMQTEGLDPDGIRLAVTSLYRDEQLQTQLSMSTEGGYFAAPPRDSSHLAGAAFDFDPNGYYQKNSEGKYVSMQPSKEGYSPKVTEILRGVLESSVQQGRVNFVIENKIEPTPDGIAPKVAVYHVCTNPTATNQSN